MDLSELSSKNKRIKSLIHFIRSDKIEEKTVKEIKSYLIKYQEVLAKCWKNQKVEEADAYIIQNLERKLNNLHEEGRLYSRPNS